MRLFSAILVFFLIMAVPAHAAADPQTIDLLDIKDMEVADVLKLISLKAGVNIIATQQVKGRVSAYLRSIEARGALHEIARANGWAFDEQTDIIRFMTAQEFEERFGHPFGDALETSVIALKYAKAADLVQPLKILQSAAGQVIPDEKSNTLIVTDTAAQTARMRELIEQLDAPTGTKVFRLHYAKAEDMAEKLVDWLSPGVGRVKFDPRSNQLIVADTAARLAEAGRLIEALDRREDAVHVEAKIVQVVLSDEFKLGIDWEALVRDYHDLRVIGDFDILGAGEKKGTVTIGDPGRDNYTVLVNALSGMGETNILSNPSITALNNTEAKILVGSSEPYVTSTVTTPASGPATTAESVTFIDVGVKLFVTPTIHADDFITMKIRPEVSSVTRTITSANNNVIPVVETSEAETTVVVKDGVTVVIGGLIKDERIADRKMVPVLGKIPVLGAAFRGQSDATRKTELVIFLKPRIL